MTYIFASAARLWERMERRKFDKTLRGKRGKKALKFEVTRARTRWCNNGVAKGKHVHGERVSKRGGKTVQGARPKGKPEEIWDRQKELLGKKQTFFSHSVRRRGRELVPDVRRGLGTRTEV